MTTMRAKMKVSGITQYGNPVSSEALAFTAVAANEYPADGSDENNTFAKWTPSAGLTMSITNPALLGQFKIGDTYYLDFTPAPQ